VPDVVAAIRLQSPFEISTLKRGALAKQPMTRIH